ncbi:MAG: ABC transporter substrate-binding protein [Polyangiaceae bacterium]
MTRSQKITLSRRAWLAGVATVAAGCRAERDLRSALRIGFMPNIGHAVPLLVAKGSHASLWRDRVGEIEMVPFSSGPAVMEALAAGELDVAYMGPPPVINAFVRGRIERPRILAGAAIGGASLITRRGLVVTKAEELVGLNVASPQLGNTQDVALRAFLNEAGVSTVDRGGSVTVVPLANSDAFELIKRGRLDAAWVPEPWATRMVQDAGAHRSIDERTLWPDGRFPTVILAVSRRAMATASDRVAAVSRAHHESTERLLGESDAADQVTAAMGAVLGKKLPVGLMREAWNHFTLSTDPCVDALEKTASRMRSLGYLPGSSVAGLIVDELSPRAGLF